MRRTLSKVSDEEIKTIYESGDNSAYLAEYYNIASPRDVKKIKRREGIRIHALTEGLELDSVRPQVETTYPNTNNSTAKTIRRFFGYRKIEDNGCWTLTTKSKNQYGCAMFAGLTRYKEVPESQHGNPTTNRSGVMIQGIRFAYMLLVGELLPTDKLVRTDKCKAGHYKACVNPAHVTKEKTQQHVADASHEQNRFKFRADKHPKYLSEVEVTFIYTTKIPAKKVCKHLTRIPISKQVIYSIRAGRTYADITKDLQRPS